MKKVVKKLFFVWNENKEKDFLEEMALKGYRLTDVGFGRYSFEQDEPKKLIYQFDFKGLGRMDEKEYLQIYEDAGWDFVSRFGGWYYFSKERTEKEIDLSIFNNNESKRAKYRRLLVFLAITGFPLYYQTFIFFPTYSQVFEFPGFYFFFRIIMYIVVCLHIFAVLRIVIMYKRIKSQIKE